MKTNNYVLIPGTFFYADLDRTFFKLRHFNFGEHLVKDYKDFTGLRPVAFHDIENNDPERKFGLSERYYS